MTKTHTILKLLAVISLLVGVLLISPAVAKPAYAVRPTTPTTPPKSTTSGTTCTPHSTNPLCGECASASGCVVCGTKAGDQDCTDEASSTNCSKSYCDLIKSYVDPLIEILSGVVGIVVVISIILGGIQYSTSAGDAQKVSAAKSRISKAIVALLAYAFLYAFLQFLLPGGILHKGS